MPSSTTEPLRDIFDAGGRGLQHHGLRRANERAVLTVVGFNPGVSNAEIARLSGLAPQTVSAILADIDRAGLIARGDVLRGRRGQPATPIFLRAEGALSIGVEIGWRHVDVLLLNLHAEVMARQHRTYDFPDARTIFADIAEMVATTVGSLSPALKARLLDLGVAMPTNISANLGLVDAPFEQQALWSKVDIVAELGRRTGLEVSLFNDGNAACWAELIAFPRPRPGSFIYFLVSRYIAAGIVGEGMLWEGPTGNSANLGSMLVSGRDGRPVAAHFIASTTALAEQLKARGIAVDIRDVETWDWDSFGTVLDQWISDSAAALARVVFNTTTVIESGMVVLDGIVPAGVVQRLVNQLEIELKALPVAPYVPPQVVAGHLGALAPAIGAAELTLYRRFFSRSLVDLAG
jgi:predicted NBD/HSP70 family sugar kinase